MSLLAMVALTVSAAFVFGHPLQPSTPSGVEGSVPLHRSSWNESQTNGTQTEGFPTAGGSPFKRNYTPNILRSCPFPTCSTANLGSSLQTGDEMAGKSTSDPLGNGKR